MTTSSGLVFKKPPVTQAIMGVQFLNNLEVADSRGKFHSLIKKEFPIVNMPKQSNLQHDFGDYSLYTENLANRLEIGMNYFRLATTSYPGFSQFKSLFQSSISMFARCYELESFQSFAMQYQNNLPLREDQRFEDCFRLDVTVPPELETDVWAGRGTLVFQEPEGRVAIEIDPQFSGNRLESYRLNLTFTIEKLLPFGAERNDLSHSIEDAHGHLSKFFFSILKEDYIEHLRQR